MVVHVPNLSDVICVAEVAAIIIISRQAEVKAKELRS